MFKLTLVGWIGTVIQCEYLLGCVWYVMEWCCLVDYLYYPSLSTYLQYLVSNVTTCPHKSTSQNKPITLPGYA